MFEHEFKNKTDEINKTVISFLPADNVYDDHIKSSVRYSVSAGGKRIRPLLMKEAYELFGGGKDHLTLNAFMAAMEFIHSYSLVHDDLPAMDDATLRRGKPATHIEFGEAFGVLAGDALLNLAYEVVASRLAEIDDVTELKRAVRAFKVLSEKSGMSGMVGGQSLDVLSEKNNNGELSSEELKYIYDNKTGALIEAALMIGAILAGANEEEIRMMEDTGSAVGLSYQIEDDIIDMLGNEDETGKDSNADIKNQKTTYVTIYGVEESKKRSEELIMKAVANIEKCNGDAGFLRELFLYLTKRTN